jgi:hypothetical protein
MALNPDIDPMRLFVGPPDSQMTMIARLTVEDGRPVRVSYRPCMISDDSEPEALPADDPRYSRVMDYVERLSVEQGLAARFRQEGDEVAVE